MYIFAVVYSVEFQKRGLPHAHILLWLESGSRLNVDDIDKLISAKIPDKDDDPVLHEAVTSFMMHGPCGLERTNSPCMVDNKCSKHHPKSFYDRSSMEDDGYCKYRRRNNGRTVEKNGIHLDNRFS